jgi:hypothetical protein
MKRWPIAVIFLYAATLLSLALPSLILAVHSDIEPRALPNVIRCSPYWLWVAAMLVCQLALLLIRAGARDEVAVRPRSIFFPIALAGLMVAGLAIGAFYSLFEFFLREDAHHEKNAAWVWHYPLIVGGALWVLWAVVFYQLSRRRSPEEVVARQRRLLLTGCLLELLIAVPTHAVARWRGYCLAGLLTSFGISFGLAVLLFAFGPAVLFLYAEHWKYLKARRRERRPRRAHDHPQECPARAGSIHDRSRWNGLAAPAPGSDERFTAESR